MGMYTEIYLRCELRKDVPQDVLNVLFYLFGINNEPDILPNHAFFKCDRWSSIGHCSSYYHIPDPTRNIWKDDISQTYFIVSRSDIKNYDNEIEKFFDWIMPYIDDREEFIGYSMYEECKSDPILYFKNKRKDY